MSSDDDLRRVLSEDAARAANPDDVWARVRREVQRRRQRLSAPLPASCSRPRPRSPRTGRLPRGAQGSAYAGRAVAGADLLAGGQLPLAPGAAPTGQTEAERAGLYEELAAFGGAGYTEEDAAALGEEWGEEAQTVRLLVGHLLLEDRLQ